jgi:hypothetical protein
MVKHAQNQVPQNMLTKLLPSYVNNRQARKRSANGLSNVWPLCAREWVHQVVVETAQEAVRGLRPA